MTTRSKSEKQQRLTLLDCRINQDKLREKLKELISENRPLKFNEKKQFFDMLPKALLSQGSIDAVSVVIKSGWFTYASIQNFAHRLSDLYSSDVYLKTSRPEQVEITIPISELWQFLYDKCLYLFPLACGEALHISAETQERPQQGSFEFTSRSDLG